MIYVNTNTKHYTSTTRLTVPPSAWTIPVPYALEARSGADVEALRDELVEAGVLPVESMLLIQSGTLPLTSGLAGQQVAAFQIGKYEVTWDEWQEVRTWAVANGYSDLANVGAGIEGNHPVHSVSWHDVLKWMNAKNEKEGLTPVYQVGGAVYKTGQSVPTLNSSANGYRLPTEVEWEWAARGGVSSQAYPYSGSNDVNAVAWYQNNSEGGTKAVGTKAANELGIYDMSGNAWEWCWDIYDPFPSTRRIRGGSWSHALEFCCLSDRYGHITPSERYEFLGFRLVRRLGK